MTEIRRRLLGLILDGLHELKMIRKGSEKGWD